MKTADSRKIAALVLALLMTAGLLAGCSSQTAGSGENTANESGTAEPVTWKLASCWAEGTGMYEIDKAFANYVSEITNGNFTITTYPAGQLCEATGVLEFVQNGAAECGGDWAGYWTGYNTAFDLLGSTVYNFTNLDYYLWINEYGGQALYDEIYGQYGLKYFITGISGMESGIRSTKPITSLNDLRGMKVRFAGLIQGRIAEKIGLTPVSIAANELYEALSRGTIDATEYSIPSNDALMHLEEVCGYWLAPGWHQTSSVYGCLVNQSAYDKLPEAYKQAIDLAARLSTGNRICAMIHDDAEATQMFIDAGVQITSLSDAEMEQIRTAYVEATKELSEENADYKKVYDSMQAYRDDIAAYRDAVGEWGFGSNFD